MSKLLNNFTIYCVNRAADAERKQQFEASCASIGVRSQVIEAVDSLSPSFSLQEFAKYLPTIGRFKDRVPLGSFGNWMSQLSIWRRIAASNQPGLICEDDTVLTDRVFDLDRKLAAIPPSWDLVFGNNRCSPPRYIQAILEEHCKKIGADLVPLGFLMNLFMLQQRSYTTPGADCYLLAPSGARRLVALAEKFGVFDYLDWTLVRYSLAHYSAKDFFSGSANDKVDQPWLRIVNCACEPEFALTGYALLKPISETKPQSVGGSVTKGAAHKDSYIDVATKTIRRGR